MSTHITLVGGQTDPVYQGIVATKPNKIFYICSSQTKEDANRIANHIKVQSSIKEFDPVDIDKINKSITALVKEIKTDEIVTINISSGTKPWSILLFDYFKNFENASIIYIDQNNYLWDLRSKTKRLLLFNMDAHFVINGNPLNQFIPLEDFTEEDKKAANKIRLLRSLNYNEFNRLVVGFRSSSSNIETKKGSRLSWDSNTKTFTGVIVYKNNKTEFSLSSKHIRSILLSSGWFELEVAQIFSSWKYSKDIRLNCKFRTVSGSNKNEIDIIINTGNKLLFVECKTQINNITDIDKFAAAVRLYGGLGSKALFITDAPMVDKAIEKCNNHSIIHFSFNENSALSKEQKTKLFLNFLENQLFKINAR